MASDAAPTVTGMLRALTPDDTPPPPAYRVPWQVDRGDPAHPRVRHRGDTPADFVRVFRPDRSRGHQMEFWGQVLPGEVAELCLCDIAGGDAFVTIAWFRSETSEEFVWRFTL